VATPAAVVSILVLAADPHGLAGPPLQGEAHQIRQSLGAGPAGLALTLEAQVVGQAADLSRWLLQRDPVILHLSVAGESGADIFLREDHHIRPVSEEALAGLIAAAGGRLECVVLSGCWSAQRADALLGQVRCVVGVPGPAETEATRAFSAGFYRALALGKGYREACELGQEEIRRQRREASAAAQFATHDPDFVDGATGRPRATRAVSKALPREAAPVPLFPLWFGTHRRSIDQGQPGLGFSGERDGRMHLGWCQVAVPRSHRIGQTEPSWWQQLWNKLLRRPDERLRILGLAAEEEGAFWEELRSTLAGERGESERQALVYLHGYNVTFEQAAIRAAQIGMDLQFAGVTAFYSWPSRGRLSSYTYDEAAVDSSEKYVRRFLVELIERTGVRKVHVIAHSMGNRALLRVAREVTRALGRKPFGQVVLAAPDVDADLFADLADAYAESADRTTLYVSSRDRALALSQLLHDYPRAGYEPPTTVVPGIDTVQAAGVDLTLLGHGYYAEARPCLADIHTVLTTDTKVGRRFGVREELTEDGRKYWRLAP
jgi:esterase/lipase superfamily enzyme